MFGASRLLFKAPARFAAKKAFSSSSSSTTSSFREKTTREIWLGDAGAYPVMGVIAFAVLGGSFALMYFSTHQDTRVYKASRKSLFRGDLKGVTE